jgi:hypothetical protein
MASQLSMVTSLRLHSSWRADSLCSKKMCISEKVKGWLGVGVGVGGGGTMWSIAKKHPLTVPALFGVNMDTPTSPSPPHTSLSNLQFPF